MRFVTALLLVAVALCVGFIIREMLPEEDGGNEYGMVLEEYVDSLAESQLTLRDKDVAEKNAAALRGQIAVLSQEIEERSRERQTQDRPSPRDRVLQEQIHAGSEGVFLDIAGTRVWYAVGTKSMDPLMDAGTNAITLTPRSEDDLDIGDIVVFRWDEAEEAIAHRIVDIRSDELGTYYVTKGDNNPEIDDVRVRFEDIHAIIVAIVY